MNEQSLKKFKDILEPRRNEFSNLKWTSRTWCPSLSYARSKRVDPNDIKRSVFNSERVKDIIQKISKERNVSDEDLKKEIRGMLDEIGYSKQLTVIRTLGLALTKILQKTCLGLHVNEFNILQMKAKMGSNPVIFVPSHRSYADFILMSYVCFTYDIEIPAIAAGMDFHGMWGMGSVLRDTGAFFMRRAFSNDRLYSSVFDLYVRELITAGDLAVEFFIEGTRSRSCKSLPPKFGFLSMVLKPFIFGEVPDITIVPINISYDRVMEEKLFAFEILGVPKPKESTSGFFKSLNIIKENYGHIFVDFAPPISAKKYFERKIDRSKHALGPVSSQILSPNETSHIFELGYDIVHSQQRSAILTAFNLISILISNNIVLGNESLQYDDLIKEVTWLKSIMEVLGATVAANDIEKAVTESLQVHKNLVTVSIDNKIKLIQQSIVMGTFDKRKLKGYELSDETMTLAVSMIQLQLYINPCMHYLIGPALITLIIKETSASEEITKDELWTRYRYLRRLLAHEFVVDKKRERMEFDDSLQHLDLLNIVEFSNRNETLILGNHRKLQIILCNMLLPFLITYSTVCEVFTKKVCEETTDKQIWSAVQQKVEEQMWKSDSFVHPYALSLDSISASLQGLTAINALEKLKQNGNMVYKPNILVLNDLVKKLENLQRILKYEEQDFKRSNYDVQVGAAKL